MGQRSVLLSFLLGGGLNLANTAYMFLISLNVIMVPSLLLLRRGFSKVLCWPEPVPVKDTRQTLLGVMEAEVGQ